MSQPRLAALFLAVLAAGTAVLVTMVTLLVQFRGGVAQAAVWRSLVVALGGVGIALSVMGLVHLTFIAARSAAGVRREQQVGRWMQVWSAVASGAKTPLVPAEQQVVAATAAAALIQELSGEAARRIRSGLMSSGVTTAELARAAKDATAVGRPAIEALERLAWVAPLEALGVFERASRGGVRASRAALLGAVRVLATQRRPQLVGRIVLDMVDGQFRAAKDPNGARPYLAAALLDAGDHLGWLCDGLLQEGRHEYCKIAALDALSRAHRQDAGERAADVLLRGAQGETKAAALKGLARLGLVPPGAVGAVVAATEDDNNAVRVTAVHALAGVKAAVALPTLWHCLADRVWEVRLSACDTLAHFGADGQRLLRRAVVEHEDRFARDIACMALGLPLAGSLGVDEDDLLTTSALRPPPGGMGAGLPSELGAG